MQKLSGRVALTQLMRANEGRYPYLLQSVTTDPDLARFDVLCAFPGDTLELDADGLQGPASEQADGFLSALDVWWGMEQPVNPSDVSEFAELPFRGGWFLYLGYELAAEVEPSLNLTFPAKRPVAFATRIPAAVIYDHLHDCTFIVAEPSAADCAVDIAADIEKLGKQQAELNADSTLQSMAEEPAEDFIAAVNAAKAHIRAGDIFQANLSRRWQGELKQGVAAVDVYERLCAANPAPFAGLAVKDDYAVISSSPERLIRRRGDQVDTRPIAGTRPRNESVADVSKTHEELLTHPKERAEHIMLIDLERNDLGRVCTGGSVKVDEFMAVESYSHVHHIVSNVSGTLRAGVTPGELIRAVFPGGTITGCPKVRCMEIIQELEMQPRGAYTGSMGFLNLNGDCDLNILIRTMTLQKNAIELAAGAGIVADSNPQRELEETRAKAKGLLLALHGAES